MNFISGFIIGQALEAQQNEEWCEQHYVSTKVQIVDKLNPQLQHEVFVDTSMAILITFIFTAIITYAFTYCFCRMVIIDE